MRSEFLFGQKYLIGLKVGIIISLDCLLLGNVLCPYTFEETFSCQFLFLSPLNVLIWALIEYFIFIGFLPFLSSIPIFGF
jgi:hypothetical protein